MPDSSKQLPVDEAFRSLISAFGMCRRVMDAYFTPFGISGSQWGLLQALRRAEEEDGRPSIRVTELSERLIVRPPSVTGAIDRLQRMGLVARVAARDDHRAKQVSLTAAGKRLIEKVWRGHRDQVENVLAGLSNAERQDLQRLLSRLNAHLKVLTGPHEHTSRKMGKISHSDGNGNVVDVGTRNGRSSKAELI